jgi:AmiR/NasT family two-component response regulator
MAIHQISEDDAFAHLVHHSNDHNRKLRDVATHPLPDGDPAAVK